MCLLCGAPATRTAEFAIVARPAVALRGRFWEGSHAEAAGGAVRDLLERVRDEGGGPGDLWGGPIVAISRNDRADGFRFFAGIAGADAVAAEGALPERLHLPPLRFATAWHHPEEGAVVERYGRMIDWVGRVGHRRDVTALHHAEEYPRDADFAAPAALRLMLPIV